MSISRTCANCAKAFLIEDQDIAFLKKVSPVIAGVCFDIPPPTLCPMCRLQRRLSHRNQIFVYLRPSDNSGKQVFSGFQEGTSFPVVDKEYWWGDEWDPASFGRAFDFSRPFFEQFQELRSTVPHVPTSVHFDENSDYCNHAGQIKNCYFVFNTNFDEDCLYCETIPECKDCIDCSRLSKCELCYDCVECEGCYNLQSCENCHHCSDSYFLLNCRSCKNCFGCANLRQAEYCIFNEQVSPEKFKAFINSLDLSSHATRAQLQEEVFAFHLKHPRPHAVLQMSEDVTGNFISGSRRTHQSYSVRECEDVKYSFLLYKGAKDCYDLSMFGNGAELMYECLVCGIDSVGVRFCDDTWDGNSELMYCILCMHSQNLFGCIAMRQKQYCILNKQYSREEYETLLPRIIEHMRETREWGEFFPVSLSPIPYNRSMAMRYFPLSEKNAASLGARWTNYEPLANQSAIDASELPDGLPETNDSIIVKSQISSRPFRITGEEIKRCRKMRSPLPRISYDERMEARQRKAGGVQLFERTCAKTGNTLLTTFAPEEPWIIWDSEEYEREFAS